MLRELLADQLARKVQAHGLVVWEDSDGEYTDVASSLAPDNVRFEAFEGSWYELRRRIEGVISAERPPALVVYAPAAPEEDPLAEVRAAAVEFKRKLATLVRQGLDGQLSPARITQIAKDARTLAEAEAAVEGVGDADVRLVGVLGPRDAVAMLVGVLVGSADDRLTAAEAWDAVASLAKDTVGADVAGAGDDIRVGLFQHLLLCDMARAMDGAMPDALAAAFPATSAAQQRAAGEALDRLRAAPDGLAVYRRLAQTVDERLALASTVEWRPGLDAIAGTAGIEEVVFTHAIRAVEDDRHSEALSIAERRLTRSPWASDPPPGWGSRWRAVQAIARLNAELQTGGPPRSAAPGDLLGWYAERGWQVDRAHRRLELARTELGTFGDLEDALTAARTAYDRWLDDLLDRFVRSVADETLDVDGLVRQGEIHSRFLASSRGRTAYVWVDALRYELGVELAEALSQVSDRVEVHGAVAAAPTITPVGMANLLPDAATDLRVGLDGDRIQVLVGGTKVSTVADRVGLLRARHGSVADLDLNDASQKGEKALGNAIGDADLVLIRSQEVDAAGESGLLSVAWTHFQTVINLLASVIARLAQCGVERVVISADHGFIALSQDLGTHRTVDAPAGATGTTKRRVFIGRGGTPNDATARVPLAACGITSDLDLIVPRGLAVFRAGGGRQFFHGGLSPQELVIPVIVVELAQATQSQKLTVDIGVAGGRITTGVFAASLAFQGDLFTNEVTVRVVAGAGSGVPVARVVSGDGYDPETGSVTVTAGRPSVLTFQVTENLGADTEVDLQVLDARTGRKLASSAVPVSSPILVEDELD
ncbi:MAG: PglZ domain-containing protein [Acidimicrobiia bacterium]|nr:PglZ domain-containing protein [Acidimicrobiia bacterium]